MRGPILLSFLLNYGAIAQTTSCPCAFEVELLGVDTTLAMRTLGYKYYGNGVKPRRMEPLWYPNALQGETPMEPTAQWFAEHSACGNDLYCVDKVTYEKLVLDTDPPGTTYQHVHVRVKLRRR